MHFFSEDISGYDQSIDGSWENVLFLLYQMPDTANATHSKMSITSQISKPKSMVIKLLMWF